VQDGKWRADAIVTGSSTREREGKCASSSLTTLHPDPSALLRDNLGGQIESQSQPCGLCLCGTGDPIEAREDTRLLLDGDTLIGADFRQQ